MQQRSFGMQRRCFSAAASTVTKGPVSRDHRPLDELERQYLKPAHCFRLMKSHGTTFFSGVPDSLLRDFCAFITDNVPSDQHIIAANEGTALAHAAGHYMATGAIPCVYLQNSGLGNTINPLLSLADSRVYSIPILLLIGWRGEPGRKDEPQHNVQGKLTPGMLTKMGVPYDILPQYAEGAFQVLEKAYKTMEEEKKPFALLVRKATFDPYDLKSIEDPFASESASMLYREEILEKVISTFPKEPLVTTTGFTSREMFELRVAKGQSHAQDFLTVGSMGHCSSIALGIAASKVELDQQVLCIDGDGAALMHMGAFVTAGQSGLRNFKHILINNATHDSVGGQPTKGQAIDFPSIARACGYKHQDCVSTSADIEAALDRLRAQDGPSFLEIRAKTGARPNLGRPTTTTLENKEAFMNMLRGNGNGSTNGGT